MTNIANPAAECNSKAAKNNITASAKSAFTPKSTSERDGDKIHSFSRKLAREIQKKKGEHAGHAAHEATVLKYLANRVRASKNIVDGKEWFYTTLKYLHTIFPYLSKSVLGDIVHRLANLGYCEIGNFNKHKYDYTFWYHVPENIRNAADEDLIYFSPDVAVGVGVPGAILQRNFDYWMNEREEKGLPPVVHMSPTALAEQLPFSVDTIERGLKKLDGKYIKKVSTTVPLYEKGDEYIAANPVGVGANPVGLSADPVGVGANPVDDTYCKTIGNPLEKNSKEEAELPSSELPSDGKNNICSSEDSLHGGITPDADEQGGAEMCHEKERLRITVFSSPSNDDHIPGEASNVSIKWPSVANYEQLHSINRKNAEMVSSFEKQQANVSSFQSCVDEVCRRVLAELDPSTVDRLYYECAEDEIVSILTPLHQAVFAASTVDETSYLFDCIYYGSLECLVGAFVWAEERWYAHPMRSLISITHDLYLELWNYFQERSEKLVEEEFAQRRKDYASMDEHKEHDAELSPAEKTRTFRNGLNARNKVGWIFYDQKHHTDCISNINKRTLKLVQNLFEHNPHLTPADLLTIMDGVMKAYVGQPKPMEPQHWKGWFPPKGGQWHARRGHDLLFFITNLHTIVKQLNITTPIETFLRDVKVQEEELVEEVDAMAA